jgi:hypothetical protein
VAHVGDEHQLVSAPVFGDLGAGASVKLFTGSAAGAAYGSADRQKRPQMRHGFFSLRLFFINFVKLYMETFY